MFITFIYSFVTVTFYTHTEENPSRLPLLLSQCPFLHLPLHLPLLLPLHLPQILPLLLPLLLPLYLPLRLLSHSSPRLTLMFSSSRAMLSMTTPPEIRATTCTRKLVRGLSDPRSLCNISGVYTHTHEHTHE